MERLAESLGLPEIMRVRVTTFCVQRAKDRPLRGTQLGEKDKGQGVNKHISQKSEQLRAQSRPW